MKLTPKIHQAMNLAAEKHLGQTRKGNGLPYITHPFAVAFILNDYTDDEDVICAGLLHDVLEDVKGYGYAKMERDFGWKVSGIVREVSEDKNPDFKGNERLTWEKRKKEYLKHLEKASQEALLVSAADKLHNLISMVELYGEKGDEMWLEFNASAEKTLWFYKECFLKIKKSLNNKIVKALKSAYDGLEKVIKNDDDTLSDHLLDMININNPKQKKSKKPEIVHLTKDEERKAYKQFQKIHNDKSEEKVEEREIRKRWEFKKYLAKIRLEKAKEKS